MNKSRNVQNALDSAYLFWEASRGLPVTGNPCCIARGSKYPEENLTVNIRPNFILILSLLLTLGLQGQSTAEDWSIRKFNPFGPRTADKNKNPVAVTTQTTKDPKPKPDEKKVKPEQKEVKQAVSQASASTTSVAIRRRFSQFGRETAAAFQRTRQAITPEFEWPKWEPLRIKFPSLMSSAEPEKVIK